VGGTGENSSGDIFLAFSTANSGLAEVEGDRSTKQVTMLPNDALSPLFEVSLPFFFHFFISLIEIY
jgi:L-aminopeptidase/D-esterase-like protein